LRHVVFSTTGDFLVISAEGNGGLAVFDVPELLKGKKEPQQQIKTDGVTVRVLQANPVPETEQYMAAVFDSGKLCLVDVTTGQTSVLKESGVSSVTWSNKGKAVAAGMQDGTTAIYMTDGTLKATMPRAPDSNSDFEVTAVIWLKNTEFLIVYGPKPSAVMDSAENQFYLVECEKGWSGFLFHPTPFDPLLPGPTIPTRASPSRLFSSRLQNWQPELNELIVMTSSHTDSIILLTTSDQPLSQDTGHLEWSKWIMATPDDNRKAAVPRLVFGEDGDSVLVGDALDLSATEKIRRPIAALEEIEEAPHPLPAYMILTHQGVLMAWWVIWNKSIEAGTCYPGMIAGTEQSTTTPQPAKTMPAPTQPATPFGLPSTPAPTSTPGAGLFSKPSATFGSPSLPAFGSPGLGATPPFIAKPSQPFGSTTPAPAQPAAPAFGAPSSMGSTKAPAFGAAGGMGSKQSLWGAPSQPAPTSEAPANPFSAPSGGSGFAKFGQAGGNSGFTSFGSNNSGQSGFGGGSGSGFGALGQQSKPAFPGLKTEPSGSTITLGSGTGSSLPSWANTPAQQGGSMFGQKSSFNTSSFESKSSDTADAESRKRDEATPTPQAPPQPAKGLFGLGDGFKLNSGFKSDGTAKDDLPKPAALSTGSLFGGDFASTLGGNSSKPPLTPAQEVANASTKDLSTTPASPPRQKSYFPSTTPAKESATPKAATPQSDDAPLPPDFITTKPPQPADDELPPLAGSPGVKVEAPSSSVEGSPIDKEDDDEGSGFSVEEDDDDESEDEADDEEDEAEEPSPSNAPRGPQSKAGGWSFDDSVSQSPRVFPPAPSPPAAKSGATSTSDRSASPAQPIWGQPAKPQQTTSLFGQQSDKAPFSLNSSSQRGSSTPAKPLFPPPANRPHANLRSPSPIRSSSTSAIRTRREPIVAPGSSLSASIQQAKPATPEPQVSDLEDEEDERMREQLSRAIEPSRTLDDFIAYQNYAGKPPSKSGHAAQIEMIYKDINGMIDALGWNARSIKSYTEYHKQPQSGHKVNRQTLEDIEADGEDGAWFDQWTLGEVDALKSLETELEQELDAGRVQDVLGKLTQLGRLMNEKAKLMTRLNDIRREILNRKDPERAEASRKAPLTKEMSDKQKELRLQYANLLTQLSQAEEGSILLRSRIASHNAANGKANSVPTVDAVKKTIIKMTSLAEKRNNDITLIEAQMRKIGLQELSRPSSSSSRNAGTPRRSRGTSLRSSVADTPYATPPRSKMSLSELNRVALTPEADTTPSAKNGYGMYSMLVGGDSELVRLNDFVDENIDSLRATARRRKQVAAGLKKALVQRGVKLTTVS
jgi:nucleoporin NUP159